MENDFEIEIQDQDAQETAAMQLPMNFLTFGEIENDDVKVYIKQDVYKALEKLAASDTTKELGSIVLGDYTQEMGKTHVVISEYIEAKYTDASASTLTFTHETWDYIHEQHEKKYPGRKIIGWQHTHPNYGIFLSNYDMFIQENFFNLPFQIAYVIDPIQNLRGFFQWKNGKIEKLKGYYIYDDLSKPIKIEQIKVKKESAPARTAGWVKALIALLCAATVGLSCYAYSLHEKYEEKAQKQSQIQAELETKQEELDGQKTELGQQSATISSQSQMIDTLQQVLVGGVLDGDNRAMAENLLNMLVNNELTLPNQEEVIGALQTILDQKPGQDTVTFRTYTVCKGDTLSTICQAQGLNYAKQLKLIMGINGIENPDQIYIGQQLLLPVE